MTDKPRQDGTDKQVAVTKAAAACVAMMIDSLLEALHEHSPAEVNALTRATHNGDVTLSVAMDFNDAGIAGVALTAKPNTGEAFTILDVDFRRSKPQLSVV